MFDSIDALIIKTLFNLYPLIKNQYKRITLWETIGKNIETGQKKLSKQQQSKRRKK